MGIVIPTPVVCDIAKRTRRRSDEPNPFLTEGWLKATFDKGKGAKIVMPGSIQTYQVRNRDTGELGNQANKVVGEAAVAIKMLREAADTLNIGVTIQFFPGKKKDTVEIQFLGQRRQNRKKRGDANTATPESDTATPESD